jgi:hypothetical protein
MEQLTTFEAWYGRDEPPPAVTRLTAGQFELDFQDGDLRYIRCAGHEVVRRVYVAIRDVNWNTIPADITNLTINTADDGFKVQYDAFHHDDPLAFRWHAIIEGTPGGVVSYTMEGMAESDFRYCRIGFCILHPIEEAAGRPYRAATPGGNISGRLPELVEPQRVKDGFETPIFPAFSELVVDGVSGIRTIMGFEGDLFEMEDQRNWTDGSFKTYCTPIALGYPYDASTGQKFFQKVTIRADVTGAAERVIPQEDQTPSLILGGEINQRLPEIGFGMASEGSGLTEREAELISRLRPDHIKAELHLGDPAWEAELDKAVLAVSQIDSALELAVFLTDDSDEALQTLASHLPGVPIARLIVFHEAEAPVGTTSARWVQMVRKHLADTRPDLKLAGGTNGNFAELNRQRPDLSVTEGVSYTINPQVHGWDERTLIETLRGQQDTIVTAHSFCGALPVSVSSVTLKPPFNQAATEEEGPPDPDELPSAVDRRQMSLFAAAWTVGSLHALASGGADSVTYYEMTGWRGLMETDDGSPLPEKFRSFPGMVFPVYWVFSFLADAKDASWLQFTSNVLLKLEGLAFQKNNRLRLIAANLQPYAQQIYLRSLPEGAVTLRRLNEDTMMIAASDPDTFEKLSEAVASDTGALLLNLKPYETAFVEIQIA